MYIAKSFLSIFKRHIIDTLEDEVKQEGNFNTIFPNIIYHCPNIFSTIQFLTLKCHKIIMMKSTLFVRFIIKT